VEAVKLSDNDFDRMVDYCEQPPPPNSNLSQAAEDYSVYSKESNSSRIDNVGQNGNEGIHYKELGETYAEKIDRTLYGDKDNGC
jgi:hypothetical protein